jgi:hypothetical protein
LAAGGRQTPVQIWTGPSDASPIEK